MSKFFSERFSSLTPYTPGEQPRERKYIKLNTNESPFPPSTAVIEAIANEAKLLNLYSDPTLKELREALAATYGVEPGNVIATNGSDEALNFITMAYADRGFAFPDITYGFYPVFCTLNRVNYREIPLKDDFSVDIEAFVNAPENVIIANPNAPTGINLPLTEIERIVSANPERVAVIDEAYVDFGGESAVNLIEKYSNLIVVGTFSKSRSLAGGRLGFAIAAKELISDLDAIRFSTNPYNVNRLTLKAGAAALADAEYYKNNAAAIVETREYTAEKLKYMGFEVLPSKANFLFIRSDKIAGGELYRRLKERGVLVRHFTKPRIADYNRVTIGSKAEMEVFLTETEEILNEIR